MLERATSCVLNLSFNYYVDSIASTSSFSSSCNFLIELFIFVSSVLCNYISERISFFLVGIGDTSNYSGFSLICFKVTDAFGLLSSAFVIVWIEDDLGSISPVL